jgi:hypothetical protein
MSVAMDWFWVDDSLIQRVTTIFIITHKLVFTVTYSLPLLGSGFLWRTFPSSEFPNGPRP